MRRTTAGFTLIEVMVALAIVAITLGAGIRAAGALTQNTGRLADISAAQWCADNRITGVRLAHLYPDIGDTAWACDQLGKSYVGRQVVRPTPNPNFRRVDEQVNDESGNSIVTLSTVVGR
jgi:general secretion pathway protein I